MVDPPRDAVRKFWVLFWCFGSLGLMDDWVWFTKRLGSLRRVAGTFFNFDCDLTCADLSFLSS